MKAALMATALLALANSNARAQSVSIYGLLDTGVEYVSHVGAAGAGLKRMPGQTGAMPSRLGFRGSEDLGDGLSAVFVLEQGLLADGGVLGQGGRAFGRMAHVGLSSKRWGTLSFGRQYTMLFWSLLNADILGPGIYSSSSLDSYIPNARADNSIAYRGTFSGLTVGATFSLGRDAVNAGPSPAGTNCAGERASDARACREWSALLKYDAATWGLAIAVDELRGGPGAFGGLTASALSDRRVSANGYYKVSSTTLAGGVIRRRNEGSAATSRSDLWYLGVTQSLTGALTLDAELFRLSFKGSGNKATLGALRLSYLLSKRSQVYATAGHIANDGSLALSVSAGAPGSNPAAGAAQSGVMLGVRHSF
ncbi:MAG: porin [Roseateles sp.]|uniref:porin n=1 Tax=Roseateles sp. TaxID=1971397 RepID=UPI0039EA609F